MFLRTEQLKEKQMAGICRRMSFSKNTTSELWRSFMPIRKDIQTIIGTELYSAEVYDHSFFTPFDPAKEFDKWAVVEVSSIDHLPEGISSIIFPSGLYAVFLHKGPASHAAATYGFIFQTWLPGSGYELDHRPHFAVMGEKYKHEDPSSEEEIWIPVRAALQFSVNSSR